MMREKIRGFVQIILITGLAMALIAGSTQEAQAATCTWTGNINNNWHDVGNWDGCLDGGGNPKEPGGTDDVIIPAFASHYPILTQYQDVININTLTINSNAQITIDEQTTIQANQFDNNGVISIENKTGHWLRIMSPFNNYGAVNFGSEPALILYQSGTHTGSFGIGRQLSFSDAAVEQVNTFQAGSSIDVSVIMVQENHTLNVNGQISWDKLYIRSNSSVNVSGAQSVNAGEIILQGGTFISNSLSIPSGETYSGTGTLQTDLVNAGILSPGTSPGIITVDGDYTQEATGVLEIELDGTTPGSEHDQLNVSGAANLGGTLNVSLLDEFSPSAGDSFTILTFGSRAGTFGTKNLPSLDAGLTWNVDYTATSVVLNVTQQGGTVSGAVDYVGNQGNHPVTIGLFEDPSDPPVHTVDVISTIGSYPYTLDVLYDGTYLIGALMDLNNNHQPDPSEPFAWYDPDSNGQPNVVLVEGGNDVIDIDITLDDPYQYNYLPLIIY